MRGASEISSKAHGSYKGVSSKGASEYSWDHKVLRPQCKGEWEINPCTEEKGKDTGLSYCFRRESTSLRISNHQGASCRYPAQISTTLTREVQNNSNLTSCKCTLQVAMPPGNWQKQTQSPLEECSISVDSQHCCRQQTEKQVKGQQAIHTGWNAHRQ